MRRILSVGRDPWKSENGYEMKWKVECTFSDLKRILLDILRARTKWSCVQEALNRTPAHNTYKNIRVEMKEDDYRTQLIFAKLIYRVCPIHRP